MTDHQVILGNVPTAQVGIETVAEITFGNTLSADISVGAPGVEIQITPPHLNVGAIPPAFVWNITAADSAGFDDGGGDGQSPDSETPQFFTIGRVHRPPSGLGPDHHVTFTVVWFNASNVMVPGPQGTFNDLHDPDWWLAFNGTPSSEDPFDLLDNPPYYDPPLGATKRVVAINDYGPYDVDGNLTGAYPADYDPYVSTTIAYRQAVGENSGTMQLEQGTTTVEVAMPSVAIQLGAAVSFRVPVIEVSASAEVQVTPAAILGGGVWVYDETLVQWVRRPIRAYDPDTDTWKDKLIFEYNLAAGQWQAVPAANFDGGQGN